MGFFSRHIRKIAILLAVLSPQKAGDLVMKLLGAIEGANKALNLPEKTNSFRKFIEETKSGLEKETTNNPYQKGLHGVVGISALAVGEYVVQVAASLTVRQLGRLLDTAQALAKKLDGRLPFGRAEAFIALVALLLVGYGLRRRKAGRGVEPVLGPATVDGAPKDGNKIAAPQATAASAGALVTRANKKPSENPSGAEAAPAEKLRQSF